jgi:hypothetical protein
MKKILLVLVLASFFGCSKKYCSQRYPCLDKDTTASTYIERVDTNYVYLPADTTFIEIPIDCPDQKVVFKEGKIKYLVQVKDKIQTIYRTSEADSQAIITRYRESKEFKELTKIRYEYVVKHKVPKWCWYLLLFNILVVLFFIARAYLKFKNINLLTFLKK